MSCERLLIAGRVQGVGYRDWMVAEARRRGLAGWVRNRGDDTVEALICGDAAARDAMVALCRQGPRYASVTDILREPADAPAQAGFCRVASV